jgi:DNA-binding transcriptional regulator YhcF (GntR family)
MDITVYRRAGVAVRDQLVTQIELKILSGALQPGQKLPSVRALARRTGLHPNTVAAAYRDLQAAGHAQVRRGSGVYVLRTGPATLDEARGLDEMIRMALGVAFRRGFTGAEIRTAVARWMAAAPPERVVLVEPIVDARELFVAELRGALHVPVSGCAPKDLARDPSLLSGALGVCLPYYLESLRASLPGAPFESVHLEIEEADRVALCALPAGALVLVVSVASTVPPFATLLGKSLRGDEVLVETRLLKDGQGWKRLIAAADLVFADVVAFPIVSRVRPKRIRELRLLSAAGVERIKDALEIVAPEHVLPRGRAS